MTETQLGFSSDREWPATDVQLHVRTERESRQFPESFSGEKDGLRSVLM
jgi:hypothetical protein